MKTLYVSDLDGTLLRSDETLSAYTCQVLSRLTERGMLFSYATARSLVTARKVTRGLEARLPLIVYTGAFIVDRASGDILRANYFDGAAEGILRELFRHDIYPIVYARSGDAEWFSYVPGRCTEGMRTFLNTRRGDPRDHPVAEPEDLLRGDVFYIACIDAPEKLGPLAGRFDGAHVVYQRDIYTGDQWLELMPGRASSRQLMEMLGRDRLVVFGDGENDADLFMVADERYAVANAAPRLKGLATAVIGGNDKDGVAKWLEANYRE